MNPINASTRPEPLPDFARAPADYPRRVLLAVCGLSPQIVTETLYALAAQEDDPFIPTEVHLITTAEGARRAELSLLSDDLGWFHKRCEDYSLPGITLNRHNVHVMRDVSEPEVENRAREVRWLRRALRPRRVPADVSVYSPEVVNRWGRQPGTALCRALPEGRVVHG